MTTFKWGFVGAGMIAKKALYPAISRSNVGEIYAVASRDADRAMTISPKGLIYTDYDSLFADPEVDGVYISLPNAFHLPVAIKAMKAGKHVLCEKPLGMNAAEVQEAMAVAEAAGVLFVEASWNRWHPRTQRIQEIVQSGELGEIKRIRAAFTYDGLDGGNIRLDPTIGGGILYDLGPYSTVAPLWLMGFPEVSDLSVQSVAHAGGVDETTRVNYKLGDVVCETVASCNIPETSWLIVEGDKGTARMLGDNVFNSRHADSKLEVTVGGKVRVEEFGPVDPYQIMADNFARKAQGGSDWVMPLTESLRFAQLFDAAFAQIKN
ncbi:MviM Predicted dehydrogenases and related proteins [Candidatus Nanopelagicaceae bacterium]